MKYVSILLAAKHINLHLEFSSESYTENPPLRVQIKVTITLSLNFFKDGIITNRWGGDLNRIELSSFQQNGLVASEQGAD